MKKREKKQFNVRIPTDLREATDRICDHLDFGKDELAEIALMSLFGSKNIVIRAKRRMVEQIAREMDLSFELPDSQPIGLAA